VDEDAAAGGVVDFRGGRAEDRGCGVDALREDGVDDFRRGDAVDSCRDVVDVRGGVADLRGDEVVDFRGGVDVDVCKDEVVDFFRGGVADFAASARRTRCLGARINPSSRRRRRDRARPP
jgi:hypothetical protein